MPFLRRPSLESGQARIITVLILVNCVVMACLTVLSPAFLTYGNLSAVLLRMSELAMLAIAETIVLVSGGFDLSIGAVMALSGALCGILHLQGMPFGAVVALSLMSGVAFGAVNAFLVVSLRLQPFIVTLATMSIARSIVYALLKGVVLTKFPERFLAMGSRYLMKIPLLFLIVVATAALAALLLRKTTAGRMIFAVGAGERAAFIAGIRVNGVKYLVYCLSGFICAAAGLMFTSRIRASLPDSGINAPLEVITAVLIGGTAITGGKGSILGSLLGILAMFLLLNGFNLLNLNPFWGVIVLGIILIYVVGQESIARSLRASRSRAGTGPEIRRARRTAPEGKR